MSPFRPSFRRAARAALFGALLWAVGDPARVAAQVDIESLRGSDDATGLSGELGGDLSLTTGNVDFVQLAVNGRMSWARGRTTTLVVGDGGLGFLSGDRFSSSGLLHLRRTRWLRERFAPEWFAQVNYDRPLLLDFRALAGAGARVRLSEGEWGTLGAGASIMYEYERLDLPAGAVHPDRTRTVRNSTFVTVRLVGGESLAVTSTTYAQPSLADVFGDMRVLENLRVAAALTAELDLTVTFDLRYDSGPPDGIASLDTALRTGLTYSY